MPDRFNGGGMEKLYLVVLSSEARFGDFFFAEELEFLNDAHIKVSGYFSSSENVEEYRRLKREGVRRRTLIIPFSGYVFIEEISL